VSVVLVVVVGGFALALVWLLLHYGKGVGFSIVAKIWKVFEVDLKFGGSATDARPLRPNGDNEAPLEVQPSATARPGDDHPQAAPPSS